MFCTPPGYEKPFTEKELIKQLFVLSIMKNYVYPNNTFKINATLYPQMYHLSSYFRMVYKYSAILDVEPWTSQS